MYLAFGENVASAIGREGDGELRADIARLALEHFDRNPEPRLRMTSLLSDFKRESMELTDAYVSET